MFSRMENDEVSLDVEEDACFESTKVLTRTQTKRLHVSLVMMFEEEQPDEVAQCLSQITWCICLLKATSPCCSGRT